MPLVVLASLAGAVSLVVVVTPAVAAGALVAGIGPVDTDSAEPSIAIHSLEQNPVARKSYYAVVVH